MSDPLPSYKELNLDFAEFLFDCPVGMWRARLVMKAWGKERNLLLYFRELGTNRGHCIAVFHGTFYAPRDRRINFRHAACGQVFELETGKARSGRTSFLSARIIGEPAAGASANAQAKEPLTPVS